MDIELLEIRDFLSGHHPFDQLPEDALAELPGMLQVRYFRRDTKVSNTENLSTYLCVIRSGAVELYSTEEELLARLGEGDMFGYRASHRPNHLEAHCVAIEDSLVYQMPAKAVDKLCDAHTQFAYFFGTPGGDRLRDAIGSVGQGADTHVNLMTTPISEIISRAPVTVLPSASILETAEVMSRERVSSILVCAEEQLAGIVTDRDLRNRVVAQASMSTCRSPRS